MTRYCLAVLLGFVLSAPSFSQNHHSEYFIDLGKYNFSDDPGANTSWVKNYTDNIGSILIDGYLKGYLKGYRFRDSSIVVKWTEVPDELKPPVWKPGEYYLGDRAMVGTRAYEVITEVTSKNVSPDKSNEWMKIDLREPVSWKYFLPGEEDILSKAAFLRNMVGQHQQQLMPWNSHEHYYFGDLVFYRGRNYTALEDNNNKEPSAHSNIWQEAFNTYIMFANAHEANILQLFEYYQVTKSDTTYFPQILTLSRRDYLEGLARPVIHFYYDEAIAYLNKRPFPALYQSETGYIGKGIFILDDENRYVLLDKLKSEIRSGKLTVKSKSLINPAKYQEWLSDTARLNPQWSIHQDLQDNSIVVSEILADDFRSWSRPVLRMPSASLEKKFKMPPVFHNYASVLHNKLLKGERIDRGSDSIPIRTMKTIPVFSSKNNFFFIQEYQASMDDQVQPNRSLISSVWPLLLHAYNQQELKQLVDDCSFFPADYDWSTISPWKASDDLVYQLDKNFTIGRKVYSTDFSVAESAKMITRAGITYQRKFSVTSGLMKPLQAMRVRFEVQSGENYQPRSFLFLWADVKALLMKKGGNQVDAFIELIEKGKLNFQGTQLIYGLMEE